MNIALIANRIEISFWNCLISVLGTFSASSRRRLVYVPVLVSLAIISLLSLSLVARSSTAYLTGYDHRSGPQMAMTDTIVPRPENGQRNILIVLVDRLADTAHMGVPALPGKQPLLDGVWLLAYIPGQPRLTFIPIYPFSYDGEDAQNIELADLFGLDEAGKLSSEFQQAIMEKGVWWDKYLVLDRSSVAEVIDMAGGVNLGYGSLSGAEVASLMATTAQDPQAEVGLQALLVQQFCRAGRYLYQAVDPGIMAGLILDGARSDLDMDGFVAGWLDLQDTQGGLLCDIP